MLLQLIVGARVAVNSCWFRISGLAVTYGLGLARRLPSLGLPSVDVNGERQVVAHDGVHDRGSLILSSPRDNNPFLVAARRVNFEKRDGIQNGPGYRHHDMVNVTIVHVGNW